MLLIDCPHCGPRDQSEFTCGGEAHIARPADPDALTDEQWADYLFMRTNPKGPHRERWMHAHGCRRWFNVRRDTLTHEIYSVGGGRYARIFVGLTPGWTSKGVPSVEEVAANLETVRTPEGYIIPGSIADEMKLLAQSLAG